jgi:hypothetical protein
MTSELELENSECNYAPYDGYEYYIYFTYLHSSIEYPLIESSGGCIAIKLGDRKAGIKGDSSEYFSPVCDL